MIDKTAHSAKDAALGFRYQGLYALLTLWNSQDDNASVLFETLDDVVFSTSGQLLLEQLKHSLANKPSPVTIKSTALWKTLKAWVDVLPDVDVHQTRFNLVTVADIDGASELELLLSEGSDRSSLIAALDAEAERVLKDREQARNADKKLPHAERYAGCEAFLRLGDDQKRGLINKVSLKPGQDNISSIEKALARSFKSLPPNMREQVAARMIEWWDRQVLLLFCSLRKAPLSRFDVQQYFVQTVGELQRGELSSSLATAHPPSTHQPHSMIGRQIALVEGGERLLNRAILEEWRARETRAIWANDNPASRDKIHTYDQRLTEEWADRHAELCENVTNLCDDDHIAQGCDLLKWAHEGAPRDLEPISPEVAAPFYIRGSYQVLSTTGIVGWHPHYRRLLDSMNNARARHLC